MPRIRRTAAPAAAAADQDDDCNLPGCDRAPEWRGLCSAHRQTHRGLADPVEQEENRGD